MITMYALYLMIGIGFTSTADIGPENITDECTANFTGSDPSLTAGEIIGRIRAHVTCEWGDETIDTLKTGKLETRVTGIATTFLATMKVLKEAKERGLNMIITHEPTFYNHFDDRKPLEDTWVQQEKIRFIEENDIVVWRFHDYWHKTKPDGINEGLVQRLGWDAYRKEDQMTFRFPTKSLKGIAEEVAGEFNTTTVRVVGDPELDVTRVGIVPGAWGSLKQIEMINREDVEVLIVGESREWETVEYVRDMIELGMKKGLIVMGHADSEGPGMRYCAEWLDDFITEIPVQYIDAKNPLWTP